ncbi:hypothetical protein GA0115246_110775, partial [Streptomyces sp. SolWspMP-sol7th]
MAQWIATLPPYGRRPTSVPARRGASRRVSPSRATTRP